MLKKYLNTVIINDISGFKGDATALSLPIISQWVCGINPEINEAN